MSGRGESPAVARRRVRLALRRARDAKGLSQGAVAQYVGWSLSKVQRIESGDNAISATDLRALLALYEVTDQEEIEQLTEEARVSRRQRWWTKPEYRESLTPATMQLLQFEGEAKEIRSYHPALVPGTFQTAAYARCLLDLDGGLTEEQKQVRVNIRERRRAQVLERGSATQYFVLLDESVLLRDIGGLAVMADQLELLAAMARRDHVDVRVIPFTEGAMLASGGHFSVVDLAEDDFDEAVLYRESFNKDFIDHDQREVAFHRDMFEAFWPRSLDSEKTIRAIVAQAAGLRARIDRS